MSAPASIESEAERAAGVDRPNHELWKRARRPRESIDPDASPGAPRRPGSPPTGETPWTAS